MFLELTQSKLANSVTLQKLSSNNVHSETRYHNSLKRQKTFWEAASLNLHPWKLEQAERKTRALINVRLHPFETFCAQGCGRAAIHDYSNRFISSNRTAHKTAAFFAFLFPLVVPIFMVLFITGRGRVCRHKVKNQIANVFLPFTPITDRSVHEKLVSKLANGNNLHSYLS